MILNGIVRRGVDRHPGPSFVIGGGDVNVPDPLEIPILIGAAGTVGQIGTDKAAGRASRTAGHGLVLGGVFNSLAGAYIGVTNPINGGAISFTNGDMDMT